MPLSTTSEIGYCRFLVGYWGPLNLCRSGSPTILCRVANSLTATTHHSTRSNMMPLTLVAVRQISSIRLLVACPSSVCSNYFNPLALLLVRIPTMITSLFPFVANNLSYCGFLAYDLTHRVVSHADF
ncbi:hypothetical protein Tco_0626438 [Tanacetum coccineum]|uniref:Uncharacterized protein n=1 Tax=Tanacetum coccineum TaxID=301880 RepID=A0ABQ4WJN7_9ASTR